jgi:hypothetical protein
MTPEGRIKRIMTKRLKELQARYPGWLAYRMPVLRGMGRPLLDYVVCVNGLCVLIETKRDADHGLTTKQKSTAKEFETAGATVFTVYDEETATRAYDFLVQQCLARYIRRC